MKKINSIFLTYRAFFIFLFFIVGVPNAHAAMNCEGVFLSAPLTTYFRNDKPVTTVLSGLVVEHAPIAKQAQALNTALQKAAEHSFNSPWVAEYRLLRKIPKDTEELQDLGYQLIKSILLAGEIKMPDNAPVMVSIKPVPLQELIDDIVIASDSMLAGKQAIEKLESQIEMLAAMIGPPKDRLIIQASVDEGSNYFERGRKLTSTVILNRNTGVAVEINFFTQAHRNSGGPGVF